MKRLILMRHAKSDWSAGALSDHDRPMNTRGQRSASALGDWLRKHDLLPDAALCSSAERTRETLHRLGLPDNTDATFARSLCLAEPITMLAELHKATANSVLMLGHNPGIAELAQNLVRENPEGEHDFLRYPTGATLVADFDVQDWADVAWHSGTVRQFIIPRALPGMT